MKNLVILVSVLFMSASAFAWHPDEEFDDYYPDKGSDVGEAMGHNMNWRGNNGIRIWHERDYDEESSAADTGSIRRETTYRSVDPGVDEFGGRFRLAPGLGDDMTGVWMQITATENYGDGVSFSNSILFGAQSNESGSSSSFTFASEMYDGSWTEDRIDFGADFGTPFPLVLGEWYDLRATETSPGTWLGEYKLTAGSTWITLGSVIAMSGFESNHVSFGLSSYARVGRIYSVPEPSTMLLLGLGVFGLRRKRSLTKQ